MRKTRKITFTAVFAAIATILMFFEFPLPLMPPFLKIDLSGAIIMIGAFIFGPTSAVAMALLKDLIHLPLSTTSGVGELADFLMTITLVLVALLVQRLVKSNKGKVIGCISGTIAMAIMGIATNYLFILPFYSTFMPLDAIIAMCTAVNPAINGVTGYLLFGVLPFNLIKGSILSIITMLVHQKLGSVIANFHIKQSHAQ